MTDALFAQFLFAEQWGALRAHCRDRGVLLVGDLPIYVAHDSADVWARRELFQLDPDGIAHGGRGRAAGLLLADGQLWGNPLYRWEDRLDAGSAFLVERIARGSRRLDVVRLDHFRGFEAYWAIPAGAATAMDGAWRPGPGERLFER